MTKKAVYISVAVLVVFALATVVSVLLTDAMNHMSKEKAEKIVTDKHKYAGTVQTVTRGTKDDKFIYKVKVDNTKKGDIIVGVDAHSGQIIGDTGKHISKAKALKIAKHKYGGKLHGGAADAIHKGKNRWEIELDKSHQGNVWVFVDSYRGKITKVAKKSNNYTHVGDSKYEREIQQVLDYVNLNEYPKGGVLTRDRAKIWVYEGDQSDGGDAVKLKYYNSHGVALERTYDKGAMDYFAPAASYSKEHGEKPAYTENVG